MLSGPEILAFFGCLGVATASVALLEDTSDTKFLKKDSTALPRVRAAEPLGLWRSTLRFFRS